MATENQSVGLNLETVMVDKLPVAVSLRLHQDYPTVASNMKVERMIAHDLEHVAYVFHSFLSNIHKQDKVETALYSYPATVWEFFKERLAPVWFLKKYPVRYETKKIATVVEKNFMCPHMELSDNYPHALWMMNANDPLYRKYK